MTLPPREDKQRRTTWDKLTKQHSRAYKAANERPLTASSAAEQPEKKKRGRPKTLTDDERAAAAERHAEDKRRHSRLFVKVQRQLRVQRQQVEESAARQATRLAARHAFAPPVQPVCAASWASHRHIFLG